MVHSPLVSYFKQTSKEVAQVLKKVDFKNDLVLKKWKLYFQLLKDHFKDLIVFLSNLWARLRFFGSEGMLFSSRRPWLQENKKVLVHALRKLKTETEKIRLKLKSLMFLPAHFS